MDAPIGIFDSGLGGLIVLRYLQASFPGESFIYLGDTARIPYGNKSAPTIAKYTERNIHFLKAREVKAVIVACNSASSVLSQVDTSDFGALPVYNVIEPGAAKAAAMTANKKVGVIATRATVDQKAYVGELHKINSEIVITQQAAPLLVPLVEEGWDDDPITNLVVYRYVNPLVATGIDTLVLGCTHYPFLKKAIQKVTGPNIHLIDSAETMAEKLSQDFNAGKLQRSHRTTGGGLQILATDTNSTFEKLARRLIGETSFREIEHVEI
ncbi:MAG: glutamate racemase [Bdellovibrionota bacterium]